MSDEEQFFIERKPTIQSLARANEIELCDDDVELLQCFLIPSILGDVVSQEYHNPMSELAKFLLVTVDAIQKNSYLNISSYNNSLKIKELFSLKFIQTNIDKELSLNHPFYIEKLGFPEKNSNLYTREQIEKILEYYQNYRDEGKNINREISLPFLVHQIVQTFKGKNTFDKSTRYLKTNEAIFIYDTLDLLEVMPKRLDKIGDEYVDSYLDNQDKFQRIKEYLRTIERRG